MSGIPVFEASVEPGRLPGRPNPLTPQEVSPAAFGANIGVGLENVGRAMQVRDDRLAAIAAKARHEAQATEFVSNTTHIKAGLMDLLHNPDTGAYTKQGHNAIDLTNQYLPQAQKLIDTQLAGISDPEVRAKVQQSSDNELIGFKDNVATHQQSEIGHYQDLTDGAGIEQSVKSGGLDVSDRNINAQRAAIHGTLALQQQRKGYSDEELLALQDRAVLALHENALNNMLADKSFGHAQRYLDQWRDKGDITGLAAKEFQHALDAAERQAKSDAWASVAPRIADFNAAARYGLKAPMPSLAEIEAAAPKHKDAVRIYNDMVSNQQFGQAKKDMGSMTPAEKEATLSKFRPVDGKPGIAGDIDRYETLKAASIADDKDRQDMAAYARDNSLGYHELTGDPTKDGIEFGNRATVANDLSTHIGSQPAITSQDERKWLGGVLSSKAPSELIKTLDTYRGGFKGDDNAYSTFMREVMPHNPTVGIMGELGVRQNPSEKPSWFSANDLPAGPDIRAAIAKGEGILHPKGLNDSGGEKGALGLPSPIDMQRAFAKEIGPIFAGQPQMADAYFNAFQSAYAGLSSDKGDYSGGKVSGNEKRSPDPAIVKQAIDGLVGARTTFAGQPVAIPFGMNADKFKLIAAQAVTQRLRASGADIPTGNTQYMKGYQLTAEGLPGSGRYMLTQGNSPVHGNDGTPIKIDLYRDFGTANSQPPDVSRYQIGANDRIDRSTWDKRADGSDKGNGFLGLLKRPDGGVSSEISVGLEINGKEMDVPTMVPTLSQHELDWLMNNPVNDPSKIPKSILQKARTHAQSRLSQGLSPFAGGPAIQ